uniref:Uncharacterized protein n=1 Tax=Ciona intestinalis TaxID=7719 RepID=H2XZ75_CIOIN
LKNGCGARRFSTLKPPPLFVRTKSSEDLFCSLSIGCCFLKTSVFLITLMALSNVRYAINCSLSDSDRSPIPTTNRSRIISSRN